MVFESFANANARIRDIQIPNAYTKQPTNQTRKHQIERESLSAGPVRTKEITP